MMPEIPLFAGSIGAVSLMWSVTHAFGAFAGGCYLAIALVGVYYFPEAR